MKTLFFSRVHRNCSASQIGHVYNFFSYKKIIILTVLFFALSIQSYAQPDTWGFYYNYPIPGLKTDRVFNANTVVNMNPNAGIGGFNNTNSLYPFEVPKRLYHIYSHNISNVAWPNFTPEPAYLRIQTDGGLIESTTRPLFSPAGIELFVGHVDNTVGTVDEQIATIQSFELNLNLPSSGAKHDQINAVFNRPVLEAPFTNPRGLDILTMKRGSRGLLSQNDQILNMRFLNTVNGTPHVGIGTDAPLEMLQLGQRMTFHVGGVDAFNSNWYYDGTVGKRIVTGGVSSLKFANGIVQLITRASDAADTPVTFEDWAANTLPGLTLVPSGIGADERTRVGIGMCWPTARLDVRGGYSTTTLSSAAMRVFTANSSNLESQIFRVFDNGQINIGNQSGFQYGSKNASYQFSIFRNDADAVNYPNVFRIETSMSTPGMAELISAGKGTTNVFEVLVNGQTSIGLKKMVLGTRHADYQLSVDGKIVAKEIVVTTNSALWADYVFKKDYKLSTLDEVKKYIDDNGHLPGIPTTADVEENGVAVGEIQAKLLEKIEELTLHLIKMEKRIKELEGITTNK